VFSKSLGNNLVFSSDSQMFSSIAGCLAVSGLNGTLRIWVSSLAKDCFTTSTLCCALPVSVTAQYGGLDPAELRRLRQLEELNAQLKRIVADLTRAPSFTVSLN
jgi:hypothetical protein